MMAYVHILCVALQGNVAAVERLGIPALNLNDGPQGFRGDAGTSTCWPSGLTIAATWNVASMGKWGDAMGKEFVAKGVIVNIQSRVVLCVLFLSLIVCAAVALCVGANIQLGPAVCLARVPVNGRNFEYLSGEDPFLGYTLVQPAIRGIQQNVRPPGLSLHPMVFMSSCACVVLCCCVLPGRDCERETLHQQQPRNKPLVCERQH